MTGCALSTFTASADAKAAIAAAIARHGDIIFHVTGGCCDARSPLCLPAGELRLGARDILIGYVEDVAVYEMQSTSEFCCCCVSCYMLELTPGLTVGFALEAAPGLRFSLREIRPSNDCCSPTVIGAAC